jgi:hypothetical protein
MSPCLKRIQRGARCGRKMWANKRRSGRVRNNVPSPYRGVRAAPLNHLSDSRYLPLELMRRLISQLNWSPNARLDST